NFIATDAHDVGKRAPHSSACADYMIKKYGEDYAAQLLYDNPSSVIQDKEIVI
ncbi:MAG: hypothetical protein K2N98_13190, partial [Lachnospiraceae bacterium]|nr:hypothetical protein [Lachnospiraceae bacterium]